MARPISNSHRAGTTVGLAARCSPPTCRGYVEDIPDEALGNKDLVGCEVPDASHAYGRGRGGGDVGLFGRTAKAVRLKRRATDLEVVMDAGCHEATRPNYAQWASASSRRGMTYHTSERLSLEPKWRITDETKGYLKCQLRGWDLARK